MSRVGRRTKFGQPLNQRLPVYFTEDQLNQLIEHVGGNDVGTFVRDSALERLESSSLVEVADETENTQLDEVRLTLDTEKQDELNDLAHRFHQPDLGALALAMLKMASEKPEAAAKFLFGDLFNGVDQKKERSIEKPKPKKQHLLDQFEGPAKQLVKEAEAEKGRAAAA